LLSLRHSDPEVFTLRSTLLCFGVLTLLTACSSGGGDGGALGAGDPTVVSKAGPTGVFSASKESALGEFGAVPEGFALPDLKCGDKLTYDSRLRVNDVFKGIQMSAIRSDVSVSTETDVISSVSATRTVQQLTFETTSKPAVRVAFEMTCTIRQEKENPVDCEFKAPGLSESPFSLSPQSRETCSTDFSSNRFATSMGSVALGTYKLASGQSVRAQKLSLVNSNVDFKCGVGANQKFAGTGKVISEQIETRDLVTRTASACTPSTTVYRKVVYQLDDGTILQASVDETTQAPRR
jgi:hypothetical protein